MLFSVLLKTRKKHNLEVHSEHLLTYNWDIFKPNTGKTVWRLCCMYWDDIYPKGLKWHQIYFNNALIRGCIFSFLFKANCLLMFHWKTFYTLYYLEGKKITVEREPDKRFSTFLWISVPRAPECSIGAVSNFWKICREYSRMNIYVTEGNIMHLTDGCWFLISCVIQNYAPVVEWGGGGVEEHVHNVDYDPKDKH